MTMDKIDLEERRQTAIRRWYDGASRDFLKNTDEMIADREQRRQAIERELKKHREIESQEREVTWLKRAWKKLQSFFDCEPQLVRLPPLPTLLFLLRPHAIPGHAVVYLLECIEQLSSSMCRVKVELSKEEMPDGVLWVKLEMEGKQIVKQEEFLEEQAWCVVSRPASQCIDLEAHHYE